MVLQLWMLKLGTYLGWFYKPTSFLEAPKFASMFGSTLISFTSPPLEWRSCELRMIALKAVLPLQRGMLHLLKLNVRQPLLRSPSFRNRWASTVYNHENIVHFRSSEPHSKAVTYQKVTSTVYVTYHTYCANNHIWVEVIIANYYRWTVNLESLPSVVVEI